MKSMLIAVAAGALVGMANDAIADAAKKYGRYHGFLDYAIPWLTGAATAIILTTVVIIIAKSQ